MALKAGVVFATDPRGGFPQGVVLETPTGHMIEWRFADEQASASLLAEICLRVWWWQRVPAISVYGTAGSGPAAPLRVPLTEGVVLYPDL